MEGRSNEYKIIKVLKNLRKMSKKSYFHNLSWFNRKKERKAKRIWIWQDSNPQPRDYELCILSITPRKLVESDGH